ncbi:MAG: DUF2779 domain-containing protein [Deltaproteobacteria bacterium]|nr:DUF2779 domain-containing protein [Deltaproteobacteria bacterium]
MGEVAREHVPGGVLVEIDWRRLSHAVRQTTKLIAGGASVIYEACFSETGVFVAVDVLERAGDGWVLAEVKSTASAKATHIDDAAIQTHIVEAAGLSVERIEIMHLNGECVFPDLSNLFARTDVTERVRAHLPEVPARIEELRDHLAGDLPDAQIGDRCKTPYDCPFMGRCWPELPANHIGELHSLGKDKRAEFTGLGYETIDAIPADTPLTAVHARQRKAVTTGEVVVEAGLAERLRDFELPQTFLDFETIGPAIPVWPGCHPYGAVVVQFSVHHEHANGVVEHREWLAQPGRDPQEECIEQLLAATAGARRVAAYGASFERTRIDELGKRFPQYAERLGDLAAKLIDLLPVVRDNVYHPGFHGSFSLKSVLPALVPDESYAGLAVADGYTAATALEAYLLGPEAMSDAQREKTRLDLLAYCKQDTWSLVVLARALRGLVRTAG